ncbi:MAG TPA: glycosyltransferase family 2 protein [Acidimicrobiia bacterium]|nr:glycosyltransferase family 2 protein [Acidimicrobiia bacterium]
MSDNDVGDRTLVVIPAYNEADSIPPVLEGLGRQRPDLDVLVVSDGSSDDTARIARAAGVAVVELPFNLGIGGALRTGFRYAVEHDYASAVQFDADGQHDPDAIAAITAPLASGADLVIGSRFVEGGAPTYAVSRTRRLAMRGLERVVRTLVGRRFTDTSSGFRAFSRPMLVYFARSYPVEYMDSVEALVLANNAGFDVREVAADMHGRTGGAPSTRSWRLIYYYARLLVFLLTSYTRPASRADRVTPDPSERARASDDSTIEEAS